MSMNTTKNLPEWLHSFIYETLGGYYQPDRIAARDNLNSGEKENQRYLGTYFPRSYTESYCIFSNLFENAEYQNMMKDRDTLRLLSFGCGTGGDLLGLMGAIAEKLPWIRILDIVAYDGNFNAVDMLKKIVEHPAVQQRFETVPSPDYSPIPMKDRKDFNLFCSCLKGFDVIVSMKMVNELCTRGIFNENPIGQFMEGLYPHLDGKGVMLVSDVPIKPAWKGRNDYMPVFLTEGLRSFLAAHEDASAIVPIPCHTKGVDCKNRCYPVKTFYGNVFTSESLSYCMVAHKEVADAVCPALKDSYYRVNDNNEYCAMIAGKGVKDVFDINSK